MSKPQEGQLLRDEFSAAAQGETFRGAAVFLGQEAAKHDVTLIADSAHGELTQKAFMASPVFVEEQKKAGVKHIGIELPVSEQGMLDKLANGELSKEAYVRTMEAAQDSGIYTKTGLKREDIRRDAELTADLVLNAKEEGIKVWAIDHKIGHAYLNAETGEVDRGQNAQKALGNFWERMTDYAKDAPEFNPSQQGQKDSDIDRDQRATKFKAFFKTDPKLSQLEFVEEDVDNRYRMKSDKILAETIDNIVEKEGGKMVVQYGKGHMVRAEGDMVDGLQKIGRDVNVIELYGSANDVVRYGRCAASGGEYECRPDNDNDRVLLTEGKVELGDKRGGEYQEIQLKSGSPQPPQTNDPIQVTTAPKENTPLEPQKLDSMMAGITPIADSFSGQGADAKLAGVMKDYSEAGPKTEPDQDVQNKQNFAMNTNQPSMNMGMA